LCDYILRHEFVSTRGDPPNAVRGLDSHPARQGGRLSGRRTAYFKFSGSGFRKASLDRKIRAGNCAEHYPGPPDQRVHLDYSYIYPASLDRKIRAGNRMEYYPGLPDQQAHLNSSVRAFQEYSCDGAPSSYYPSTPAIAGGEGRVRGGECREQEFYYSVNSFPASLDRKIRAGNRMKHYPGLPDQQAHLNYSSIYPASLDLEVPAGQPAEKGLPDQRVHKNFEGGQ